MSSEDTAAVEAVADQGAAVAQVVQGEVGEAVDHPTLNVTFHPAPLGRGEALATQVMN